MIVTYAPNSPHLTVDEDSINGKAGSSPTSPSPQSPQQRRRKVRFSDKTRIKRVPSRTSYSARLVGRMYYSEQEYHEILENIADELEILQKKESDPASEEGEIMTSNDMMDLSSKSLACQESVCARGLESETSELNRHERHVVKYWGRQAVFLEQEYQQKRHCLDPENMAKVYSAKAQPATERALAKAKKDAQEAKAYLHEAVRPFATNKNRAAHVCRTPRAG